MSATRSEGSAISTTPLASPYGGGVQGSTLQVPAAMTNREPMSTSPAITATTITNRNNVSVTSIKREVDDSAIAATVGGANSTMPVVQIGNEKFTRGTGMGVTMGMGIRIPLSKPDNESDSETELTNIENLKVTRRAAAGGAKNAGLSENVGEESVAYHKNGPRPMSWEGELSETETAEAELMETENSMSGEVTSAITNGATMSVIKSEVNCSNSISAKLAKEKLHYQLHPSASVSSLHAIKPDFDQITVEMHSNSGGYLSNTKLKLTPTQSDPINLKYEPPDATSVNSPVLTRNKSTNLPLPANPSPDSAIHSVYTHSSPSQSPLTSRHAPYTPSLSRNNSDASHSSCYSYSSEFSPTHSPIQGRHATSTTPLYGSFNNSLHHSVLYRPLSVESCNSTNVNHPASEAHNLSLDSKAPQLSLSINSEGLVPSAAGISRQQLINSPCPICGDKISGFHYGIFSCESCKGFFKRTVQNRKNYVCVRGGPCPVSISTRKKCPACRFDKCLQKGMKLEAIREDRTRGGRSTYQCSYTLPNSILSPLLSGDHQNAVAIVNQQQQLQQQQQQQQQHQQQQQQCLSPQSGHHHHHAINGFVSSSSGAQIKNEQSDNTTPMNGCGHPVNGSNLSSTANADAGTSNIPVLLQEIMDVEYLWQFNEAELSRLNQPISAGSSSASGNVSSTNQMTNPLLASAGFSSNGENANPDLIAHLCNVADHRLYKIVKWCKSLPLFKNISIDDQICLLINSWCELLLFSCCFRSVDTPGEIKMSQGKKITLAQAKSNGLQACIERMLNLTEHLRRLRVDRYEYVAMKVIVLLQSDTSELKEPVKVRECQEKALQSLQAYTLAHYPDAPSKFGELLLRIPDLQRTCQLGKEMLTIKSRDDGDFNLLVELLRGEH